MVDNDFFNIKEKKVSASITIDESLEKILRKITIKEGIYFSPLINKILWIWVKDYQTDCLEKDKEEEKE